MISLVQPLYAGNALRLFIEPPATAVRWKVLRKGSDTFLAHDDASAYLAYDGDERVVVDAAFLQNDVMAFYRPFYTDDGVAWSAGPTAFGTPAATYDEATTDVLDLIRDRLEAGLKVECDRGSFATQLGYIQVIRGAASLERDLQFPLVTCHLEVEDQNTRFIGEDVMGDLYDAIGDQWEESEGWLANVRLTLVGWSLNGDERNELRKAIRRVVMANLPVFASYGWEQVELRQEDVDAVNGEYQAPLYQVMNTFSCVAPVRVTGNVTPVRDVIISRTNQ